VAGTLRKVLQALGIWVPVILILGTIWPPALHLPQLWMVASVSILANILQPSYRPFEGSRTPEDRGTAAQILWTVYLTQAAALLELVWRRRVVNTSRSDYLGRARRNDRWLGAAHLGCCPARSVVYVECNGPSGTTSGQPRAVSLHTAPQLHGCADHLRSKLCTSSVLGGRAAGRAHARPRVPAAHSVRGGSAGQDTTGIPSVYLPYIQAAPGHLLDYGEREEAANAGRPTRAGVSRGRGAV